MVKKFAMCVLASTLGAMSLGVLAADAPATNNAAPAAQEQRVLQPLPLSTAQVEKNLGAEGLYVFDCNPKNLYDMSHVPGAVHINVKEWKTLLPKDKKNSYIIFYCVNRLCTVSWEIASETLAMGYENVYVMPDGIQGWVHHGHKYDGTGNTDIERQKAIDAAAQAAAQGKGRVTK